jgi:two-component system sensor histidine kinase/response regulator
MLGVFVDSYRDAGERLAELLAAGDRPAAERLAHNCKGAAATLGAVPLAGLAAELEEALRAGKDAQELGDLIGAFGREATGLARALQEILPA